MRLILLAAMWGASFLFMRVAAQEVAPSAMMFARVAIAAMFLVVVVRGPWGPWRSMLIIGALNSALPFVLLAWAAKSLPASTLAVLNASAPAFAVLLSGRGPILGVMVGALGVVVSVGSLPRGNMLPILAALCAALSYGVASVYMKRVRAEPASIARGSMIAASALLFIPALSGPLAVPSVTTCVSVVALGVLCTGVAYLLYFRLIRDHGPTGALSVTFLVPIFGIAWSALFLGEEIHANVVAGAALVLIGTFLTTRASGGQAPAPRSSA